ncbi:MAG TPA: ATP-binding domain-containing protein, partial [Burkholderiaceae bacterium]|nr:ATP-binding domain-containing protein [Burkholderiaceae bacterium]
LIGDQHQLASVETGLVLAQLAQHRAFTPEGAQLLAAMGCAVPSDFVESRSPRHPTADAVVWLERNYRFARDSAIGQLARAIVADRPDDVLASLADDDASATRGDPRDLDALCDAALDAWQPFIDAVRDNAAPRDVLAAFERHRVLAALRHGPHGTHGLNARLSTRLRALLHPRTSHEWYAGRPILVVRNDAALGVFNGDVGVALNDAEGRMLVHFPTVDGTRAIAPERLPACTDAFALTVHKAQGSEYRSVDIVLPLRDTPLITRELLYTAVTRARERLSLWADDDTLLRALARPTRRYSGLSDRLGDLGNRDGNLHGRALAG